VLKRRNAEEKTVLINFIY